MDPETPETAPEPTQVMADGAPVSPVSAPAPSRGQVVATVMAAAFALFPVVIGRLGELFAKLANPDAVDVSQDLAYLRPLLVFGFVVGLAWMAIVVATVIRLQRREGRDAARLPWLVLGVQVLLGVVILVLQLVINAITGG
ncbi:hypothetical protein [Nocardioides sp. AE5]|uniref:hypothetical protein n=1 Tax=Nocardioides sp. AE5 TaxID=2962573 RepID=UPI002882AB80|nr:hypothetical protein [Nocardioides sp. AE5]MDT0202435.1 hypothetical protein [Nocardioides sp. AE5]